MVVAQLEQDAIARFAHLCDRAAEHRLMVSLEPRAGTNVDTVAKAAAVVSQAKRTNAGICFDTRDYSMKQSNTPGPMAFPTGPITVIKLSDRTGSLESLSVNGGFPLETLLRASSTRGVSALSVEATVPRALNDPSSIGSYLGDNASLIWGHASTI